MSAMVAREDGSLIMAGHGEEATSGQGLLARFVPGSFPDYGEGYDTVSYPGPERGWPSRWWVPSSVWPGSADAVPPMATPRATASAATMVTRPGAKSVVLTWIPLETERLTEGHARNS